MHDTRSSTLESVIDQWNDYLEKKSQLEQWMESVDQKVEHPLQLQPGLKEKFSLLDHFQSIVSEAEDHTGALQQLAAKSRELYKKTQDESFKEAVQEELRTQFQDILTVAKVRYFRLLQKLRGAGKEPHVDWITESGWSEAMCKAGEQRSHKDHFPEWWRIEGLHIGMQEGWLPEKEGEPGQPWRGRGKGCGGGE